MRNKPFVGYLERYTPTVKQKIDESAAAVAAAKRPTFDVGAEWVATGGTEFKKPGDASWLSGSDREAKQKLFNSLCPSGSEIDAALF